MALSGQVGIGRASNVRQLEWTSDDEARKRLKGLTHLDLLVRSADSWDLGKMVKEACTLPSLAHLNIIIHSTDSSEYVQTVMQETRTALSAIRPLSLTVAVVKNVVGEGTPIVCAIISPRDS